MMMRIIISIIIIIMLLLSWNLAPASWSASAAKSPRTSARATRCRPRSQSGPGNRCHLHPRGPVVSSTGARGFVHISYRETFGEKRAVKHKRNHCLLHPSEEDLS